MRQINFILLLFCITTIAIANGKQEAVKLFKNHLLKADSIELHFESSFANIEGNQQKKVITGVITEIELVKNIILLLSNQPSDCLKCGFDGTIDFFDNKQPILEAKVYFNITCNIYNFTWNGKNYCAYLNNNAATQFLSIRDSLMQ